jgi:hypothetical protein
MVIPEGGSGAVKLLDDAVVGKNSVREIMLEMYEK